MQTVRFQPASTNSDLAQEEASDTPDLDMVNAQKPVPLRHLLTRPVVVSVANYASLALLGMVSWALMPLIWSTSIEFGGLDMNPASIGVWLSVFGCMNGLFQVAIFPWAVARFGPRWLFVTGIGMFAIVYTMFPLENLVLRHAVDGPAWLLILLQLTGLSISEMCYSELIAIRLGAHKP
jgi:MFS family permease